MKDYPRLLICNASFESIMTVKEKLGDYLEAHRVLAAQLEQP